MSRAAAARSEISRRLLVVWQDPQTRRFVKVAQLDGVGADEYVFSYLPAAKTEAGFVPLAQFPDLDQSYRSPGLPAFFANRVMSRQRPSYSVYAEQLGLDGATAAPFEVLVRSGGGRATDTFHIVDDLQHAGDGMVVSRFLASGVRHLAGASERIAALRPGQELLLRDDPSNAANPKAVLIDASAGNPVGYIPDWLVGDVHTLRRIADGVKIFAERVNPDARPHLRLLCRLEAEIDPVRG